jgi:hypothetical protein
MLPLAFHLDQLIPLACARTGVLQLTRDEDGYIQADPTIFPSGIDALADYVHGLGLKFGLYSDAGFHTCWGRPGSLGYEAKDAEQYALWKVDYLKCVLRTTFFMIKHTCVMYLTAMLCAHCWATSFSCHICG